MPKIGAPNLPSTGVVAQEPMDVPKRRQKSGRIGNLGHYAHKKKKSRKKG